MRDHDWLMSLSPMARAQYLAQRQSRLTAPPVRGLPPPVPSTQPHAVALLHRALAIYKDPMVTAVARANAAKVLRALLMRARARDPQGFELYRITLDTAHLELILTPETPDDDQSDSVPAPTSDGAGGDQSPQ